MSGLLIKEIEIIKLDDLQELDEEIEKKFDTSICEAIKDIFTL